MSEPTISIDTAVMITDISRRTLWRRVKEGLLPKEQFDSRGRTMVAVTAIKEMLSLPITDEDLQLLAMADGGDAESQNEIGVMFLELDRAETAAHWFALAAKQEHVDAMHHLSRLYYLGYGVKQDEAQGQLWLAKAAAYGHKIAQAQLKATLTE